MRLLRWSPLVPVLSVGLASGACGGAGDEGALDFGAPAGESPSEQPAPGAPPGQDGDSALDAGAGAPELPPETEVEVGLEPPAVGETAIYIPNPATDHVAVVDAASFAIESVKVAGGPTHVATVPGQDLAVVLNADGDTVTLLRGTSGDTRVIDLDLDLVANQVRFSPDGRWAVLFFDPSSGAGVTPNFHDVGVVDLKEERAIPVSVGFRPSQVQFDAQSSQAFIVTEDGISVVDLTELAKGEKTAAIARQVSLGDEAADRLSVDVSVTPSGRHALARRPGDSRLRWVDLESGEIRSLDLATLQQAPGEDGETDGGVQDAAAPAPALGPAPIEISDLDVAPDGSFALAVLRSHSALVRLPLPGAFEDADLEVIDVPGELIGSVTIAPNGALAVAFTTAVPTLERITLIDLTGSGPLTHVRLRKSVRAVALSADGSRALVLHQKLPGDPNRPGLDEQTRIDQSHGYTLVDTTTPFAKLQLTPAPVSGQGGFVMTPDASHLFLVVRDDARAVRTLHAAALDSFHITELGLAAPPISLGVVPAVTRAFVGQQEPGGRITFYDWTSGETQTVTAFELSSRIRQ